ncbi:MAG TPA: ATP-binding cassette domain-containing protein [Kofleriaceae bacterium]
MIEARGLARTFQSRGRGQGRGHRRHTIEAVRGIDLEVERGEIVGLLGPNGAGKTTTQRMLATLLVPTAGEATVAGCDLRRDPIGVRRQLGYVSQSGGTNPAAKVDEELVTQAQLYGMSRGAAQARARQLRELLDLAELGDRVIKTLSGGQRRRLDIALGLMHDPKLVFLDEPSTGLDPQTRANLWTHIRALRDERAGTILLTTHYLEEADALCDRILIIDAGKIVASGTPAELKRRISGDLVTFEVDDVARARELLGGRADARDITVVDRGLRITVDRGETCALPLMRALDDAGVKVGSLHIAHPSLDDVFLTLTGRSLRDAPAA